VQEVEHPGAVPRLRAGQDLRTRVVGEPHRAAVPVLGLDLPAALVPVVDELAVQRVEVRRAREDRPAGPVAQVVLAAEGGLATKDPRLRPNTNNLGRSAGDSLDQRSYTASNNSRPASRAFFWSTRYDSQDGR
jgi:hypothetical protein